MGNNGVCECFGAKLSMTTNEKEIRLTNIMRLYKDIENKARYIMGLVNQEDFEKGFSNTEYNICYRKGTERKPDLHKAVRGLCDLYPDNEFAFMQIYNEYKNDYEMVITKIWTYEPSKAGEIRISELINIAKAIDAMSVFKNFIGNIDLTDKYSIKELIFDAKYVIRSSSLFIRLLNTFIVDTGSTMENKSVYFGAPFKFLKDLKDEEIYRVITCSWIQEDHDSTKNNTYVESSDNTIIELNIPKDCNNAVGI